MAEVDGNRTRRTRIARPNRFEGGGVHQVPGHLRPPPYFPPDHHSCSRRCPSDAAGAAGYAPGMKRIILLIAVIALAVVAAKKVQSS